MLVARKLDKTRAASIFPWKDTQDIRNEIERICPNYRGISALRKKGDNFQYGGRRLLADKFLTPDGKGHFSPLELPEERVPAGQFHLATRRGRQFNSIMLSDKDPLTGARRNDILMSAQDASRLALRNGDPITLRNELGEFHGHVRIDRIKPGCLWKHTGRRSTFLSPRDGST